MRLRFPYFFQLMVGFLLVICTVMGITFATILHFGRDQLLSTMEESLLSHAEILENAHNNPAVLESYQIILENQQVDFGFYDKEGHLVFPENHQHVRVDLNVKNRIKLEAGDNLLLHTQTNDLRGNQVETALIYVPVFSDTGGYEGFVGIGRPVSHIDIQMEHLRRNVFRAFIYATIAAIILSMIFSYFFVKRVNRLSRAAQKVALGDYDIHISHKNRDEIDRLSANFNTMIQALKEWRKEVLHLEDRRKTFMQDVAHEMRTPLTTINGLLEGLEYGIFDEKQELRSIQLMRKETTRLIRLVNENLDYENIQMNRIVLKKHKFPLVEAIEDVKEQLEPTAKDSNNQIIIKDITDEIEVYADFDRMKQIIVNLLKNALQFTEDGEITIRANQTKERTEISISDTGAGMTEQELADIWDRYYKADPSRKNTKYGESGLGLPIVKQLVEIHDGDIQVESILGKGSTFTIVLPRHRTKNISK